MEKLQEEQRIMLEEERRKREEFEKEQSEKEGQLRGNYFQSLVMKKKLYNYIIFCLFAHFYIKESFLDKVKKLGIIGTYLLAFTQPSRDQSEYQKRTLSVS